MVVAIPAAGIRLWSGGAFSPSTTMHMRRYAHQVDSDAARLTAMASYHAWTPPRSQWSTVGPPALRCERRVRECDASSEEKAWIAIRHKPRFIAETTPTSCGAPLHECGGGSQPCKAGQPEPCLEVLGVASLFVPLCSRAAAVSPCFYSLSWCLTLRIESYISMCVPCMHVCTAAVSYVTIYVCSHTPCMYAYVRCMLHPWTT